MSDKKNGTDIEFDQLSPRQQEAYIARGDYKDPELLDHGNAPQGAPTAPLSNADESVGDPDPSAVENEGAAKPKSGRKRTS